MKRTIIIVTLTILSLIPTSYIGQGWGQGGPPWGGGPGGPGNGGPPPPPDNYCLQFPNDPACANNVAVPIGSTEGMLIFMFLSGIFFYYKINGNSFKLKRS